QGEHVDVLTHGEVDGARHARADRVDVPGGQTHASSLFGTTDVAASWSYRSFGSPVRVATPILGSRPRSSGSRPRSSGSRPRILCPGRDGCRSGAVQATTIATWTVAMVGQWARPSALGRVAGADEDAAGQRV